MKLLTKELLKKLPPLYSKDGDENANAIVKFFAPVGNWTWYATEYCPETRTFFGLVCGQEKEFGYFNLDGLESWRLPMGLKIERDLYFTEQPVKNFL